MLISKLIPAFIQIKSLYWVRIEKQMSKDLEYIFDCIDEEKYITAETYIHFFRQTYDGKKYPKWITDTYCKLAKAQSMLNFLKAE